MLPGAGGDLQRLQWSLGAHALAEHRQDGLLVPLGGGGVQHRATGSPAEEMSSCVVSGVPEALQLPSDPELRQRRLNNQQPPYTHTHTVHLRIFCFVFFRVTKRSTSASAHVTRSSPNGRSGRADLSFSHAPPNETAHLMFVDGFVFYYSEENRRPVRVKQFVTFFSRTFFTRFK